MSWFWFIYGIGVVANWYAWKWYTKIDAPDREMESMRMVLGLINCWTSWFGVVFFWLIRLVRNSNFKPPRWL